MQFVGSLNFTSVYRPRCVNFVTRDCRKIAATRSMTISTSPYIVCCSCIDVNTNAIRIRFYVCVFYFSLRKHFESHWNWRFLAFSTHYPWHDYEPIHIAQYDPTLSLSLSPLRSLHSHQSHVSVWNIFYFALCLILVSFILANHAIPKQSGVPLGAQLSHSPTSPSIFRGEQIRSCLVFESI